MKKSYELTIKKGSKIERIKLTGTDVMEIFDTAIEKIYYSHVPTLGNSRSKNLIYNCWARIGNDLEEMLSKIKDCPFEFTSNIKLSLIK